MNRFVHTDPTPASYWRAIVLFGANTASYKFALGASLLELARGGQARVRLEELADPYSSRICDALKRADRQCKAGSSKYLDACRAYNSGQSTKQDLLEATVRLGFAHVLDRFHNLAGGTTTTRFYADERKTAASIVLTDELLAFPADSGTTDLVSELDARWRLVEAAWELRVPTDLLSVAVEPGSHEISVLAGPNRRPNVTSLRAALNGYQRGRCFFCSGPILIDGSGELGMDVDHLVPRLLQDAIGRDVNLDGVWNLVLACRPCNRGSGGKRERIASLEYLDRLHDRNHYLIESHHPLRETLMQQSGTTESARRRFLQDVDNRAIAATGTTQTGRWTPMTAEPRPI